MEAASNGLLVASNELRVASAKAKSSSGMFLLHMKSNPFLETSLWNVMSQSVPSNQTEDRFTYKCHDDFGYCLHQVIYRRLLLL